MSTPCTHTHTHLCSPALPNSPPLNPIRSDSRQLDKAVGRPRKKPAIIKSHRAPRSFAEVALMDGFVRLVRDPLDVS